MPQIAHYGWIPDLPDQRDYHYSAPIEMIGALPASVDLTSACPAIYDQGHLGSCTANAIAAAMQFDQLKQNLSTVFVPSRLFIYYDERAMEGTVDSDSGAMIRDGRNLNQMKGCLASGYPFVFGFTVYESFESEQVAKDGHAPMPKPGEQVLGGHAVLAVGYDDVNQWFIVRNSWGTGWGMQGYFTLPYAYLTNRGLASDFWTVRVVK